MYKQFSNLSCYEEFEIRSALTGISKIDILKRIGHKSNNNYYFFISEDGIFNWFDLEGNHIETPSAFTYITECHIPKNIFKCIIPNNIKAIFNEAFFKCRSLTTVYIPNTLTYIGYYAFFMCDALKEVIFKGKTLDEVKQMDNYPWGIKDESIIKCEM